MDTTKKNRSGEQTPAVSDEEWPAPFLAPPIHGPLVGRDKLVRQLKVQLFANGSHPLIALTQLPGVGKSALAIHLANDEEVIRYFSDGVLWVPLGHSPDVRALLGEWMLALGFTAREISDLGKVKDRMAAITQKIGNHRMLLVLDDALEVQSAREFLIGGPSCAHVVTTRLKSLAVELPGAEIVTVPELSQEDGLALLALYAPKVVEAEAEHAADLVQAVGGLPLAIVLMGKYLWKESFSRQPRRILVALEQLKDAEKRLSLEQAGSLLADVSPSLMSCIRLSDEILDETLRQRFRALSVLRAKPATFTKEVAKMISHASVENLDALVDVGLLESIPDRGYCMPRTVADYARSQLEPAVEEALHRGASSYFQLGLRKYETDRFGDATPYERMYAYEDPKWQAWKSPYAYHQSKLQNRSEANLNYAAVYFDAFWWWRCYNENFPFNQMLLNLWRENVKNREDRQWLNLVKRFQRAYPTGYLKRGRGDWDTVEKTLLMMRKLGAIHGDVFELDPRRRHVRAITNMFLAESYRYRSLDDRRADKHYEESLSVFRQESGDDSWNLPWACWHLADLSLERSQYQKARQLAKEGRAVAKNATKERCGWDNEVISNMYRVDADTYWEQGDLEQALHNYARAVYYAYIFQGCPKQLPDFYTADFYYEMTTRAVDRLFDLRSQGRMADAAQWARYLNAFWAPYWELLGERPETNNIGRLLVEDRREELVAYSFPAAPTEQDMRSAETGYVHRVRQILDALGPLMDQEQEFVEVP